MKTKGFFRSIGDDFRRSCYLTELLIILSSTIVGLGVARNNPDLGTHLAEHYEHSVKPSMRYKLDVARERIDGLADWVNSVGDSDEHGIDIERVSDNKYNITIK